MAETIDTKARRLLAEDAVYVLTADENRVRARVRSDHHGVLDVTWDRGHWSCTCPARGRCSHELAVKVITLMPLRRIDTPVLVPADSHGRDPQPDPAAVRARGGPAGGHSQLGENNVSAS